MRTCDKQVTHHASDHRWWSDVLWSGVEAGGTRCDPADHAGVFHSESDRTGAHGLRTARVAAAKRRSEEPGMLLVPAGTAQSRLASLVVAAAHETTPAGRGVGGTHRCAAFAHGPHRLLPPPPPSVARQQPETQSVSAVYPALPLSRLQGALRRATTLFCPLPTTALPNSGLLV